LDDSATAVINLNSAITSLKIIKNHGHAQRGVAAAKQLEALTQRGRGRRGPRSFPLQNRRSGFSAENRTVQFAGEMRRSADRRYDEMEFTRDLSEFTRD
jgi:hypothetical protein